MTCPDDYPSSDQPALFGFEESEPYDAEAHVAELTANIASAAARGPSDDEQDATDRWLEQQGGGNTRREAHRTKSQLTTVPTERKAAGVSKPKKPLAERSGRDTSRDKANEVYDEDHRYAEPETREYKTARVEWQMDYDKARAAGDIGLQLAFAQNRDLRKRKG